MAEPTIHGGGTPNTCTAQRHGTERQHGTRAKYVVDRCRCDECRRAVREYERWRTRQRAYGRTAYIDAQPARDHVRALQAAGMGWKRVARSAGLSESVVWKLLYGDPARSLAPSKRVRPVTAEKILAVTVDLAGGAFIDATGTRRRLQALITLGWSGSALARRLSLTPANFWRMLHENDQVTVATAQRVSVLYDQLWRTRPPEISQHDRTAATKARRYAAERGWLPPLWYDEETIDDAEYTPATHETARPHKYDVDEVNVRRALAGQTADLTRAERLEAVRELRGRRLGYDAIAARLGVSARQVHRDLGDLGLVRHEEATA